MAVRFGVIFITDDKTEELRSILEHKKEGKLLPNNNLKCYISEGSYIIDLHLIDDTNPQ
ncbi:hypothetical protein Kyoto28A_10850 [Helicobacter pylori]